MDIEHEASSELEINPKDIAVVTTTFYSNWSSQRIGKQNQVDNVRGDLAIQTLSAAQDVGYRMVVIDGGSSRAFIETLQELGIEVKPESERGMSPSRQQGFKEATELPVRAIVWTEPEKISLVRDCLPRAISPILHNEADIVVPSRTDSSFKTYPPYQATYERRANTLWNEILRRRGLLPKTTPDLDVWFGPKIFRNDDALTQLFLRQYKFAGGRSKLHEIVKPELWPNATFLPIIAALHQGYRVTSVPVPYAHPAQQTAVEIDSDKFRRKRQVQLRNIITSTIEFIRLLEQDSQKPSRLHLVS
ncbi:MAG: glycosyltransferase family 2 protein [FCB group bacterium]|nr:glycosyltransferase family 2 protein [FCB group bacterium]